VRFRYVGGFIAYQLHLFHSSKRVAKIFFNTFSKSLNFFRVLFVFDSLALFTWKGLAYFAFLSGRLINDDVIKDERHEV
jgi:hypothetical protein